MKDRTAYLAGLGILSMRLAVARRRMDTLQGRRAAAHWSWRWILAAACWVYGRRVAVLRWSIERRRDRLGFNSFGVEEHRRGRRRAFGSAFRRDR